MPASPTATYPAAIDNPQAPSQFDSLATDGVEHDYVHDWAMDAIKKIEQKLGITSSPDVTSVDYVLTNHQHQGTDRSAQLAMLPIKMVAGQSLAPLDISTSLGVSVFSVSTAGAIAAASLALTTPLPLASGGTGSTTKNFVDLTTTQATIAGTKTFTSRLTSTGLTSSSGTIIGSAAGAMLDITAAGSTAAGTGSQLGDKIQLYGTSYGLGMQSASLVAYMPVTSGLAIRPGAASGQKSSGVDAVRINADGSIVATGAMLSTAASASTATNRSYVTADTFDRYSRTADGTESWGPGNAAADVDLSRTVLGRLHVNGTFEVVGTTATVGNVALVAQGGVGQTAGLLALRDGGSFNQFTVDVAGVTKAIGSSHYFGPNAFGGAGNRHHLYYTSTQAVLQAEGSTSNVTLALQGQGTGTMVKFLDGAGAVALATLDNNGTFILNGRLQNDPGSAVTAAYFGDTTQTPGGTVGIMPYSGARGLVIKNPAVSPGVPIELQDSSGGINGRWGSGGIIQAVGPDMYFGPYAFSTGTGVVRARINTVTGATPAIAFIAESDGTTPDVNVVIRPKGGGTAQMQNSASQIVIEAGYSGGNRYLGFFAGAPALKQTVTGSRGGNLALGSLLTALATYGLIVNSSTA